MYRLRSEVEVLLVHPGGPFFAKKDRGWWGIPKGLVEGNEDELSAARREFEEETSFSARSKRFLELDEVVLKSGKRVVAWAFEGDCDTTLLRSNTFELEWPPKSGRTRRFPEVDRAEWFTLDRATSWMTEQQRPFLSRLLERLEP